MWFWVQSQDGKNSAIFNVFWYNFFYPQAASFEEIKKNIDFSLWFEAYTAATYSKCALNCTSECQFERQQCESFSSLYNLLDSSLVFF